MSTDVLGGDIKAQFISRTEDGIPEAQEACRLEQEAMCGYPLKFKSSTQTHYVVTEKDGSVPQDVYEVFVTFQPVVDDAEGSA